MKLLIKLQRIALFFILLYGTALIAPHSLVESGNLTAAKDTMDTSRSSWSTTLSVGATAASTTFSLTTVAGILPGDSVKLWGGTAETLIVGTVDSANNRITTTTASAQAHNIATNVTGGFGYDPSTDVGGTIAGHEITFMPSSSAINGGEVRITFPVAAANYNDGEPDTAANNPFDFNSMGGVGGSSPGGDIYCSGGGGAVANWATTGKAATASAGTIVIPFRGTLSNATVTCNIGQTVRSGGVHLINPGKTAASGTADVATIIVETREYPGYTVVDTVTLKVATVESVRVTATVSPTLSLIIAGTANATSVCGETTNSGTASTAVLVPLGTLSDSALNVNAQRLSIATNARDGYSLVIKDDGYLRKSNGDNIDYWKPLSGNDSPVPDILNTSGTEYYAISACGTHVNTSVYGVGTGPTVNKYGGPGSGTAWQYYRTLASSTAAVAATITSVLYKSTISGVTPAGDYAQIVTYVATGNF